MREGVGDCRGGYVDCAARQRVAVCAEEGHVTLLGVDGKAGDTEMTVDVQNPVFLFSA